MNFNLIRFSADIFSLALSLPVLILHRMLCKDPKKRATIPELLAHPWMIKSLSRRQSKGERPHPISDTVVTRLRAFANMNHFMKEARRLIATFLPEEEVHGLRRIFQEMDTDNDGLLSLPELHHALVVKGHQLLRSQAKVCPYNHLLIMHSQYTHITPVP